MALVALEIPKVGLVMETVRVVRWLKNVGDTVKQGEPLVEVETEKSVVEIEATESGRLVEILVQADQEAHVGDRIAWLENDAVATAAAPPVPGVAAAPHRARAAARRRAPHHRPPRIRRAAGTHQRVLRSHGVSPRSMPSISRGSPRRVRAGACS